MSNYKLLSDLLQQHPLNNLMLIRQEHGEDSREFEIAQLEYQKNMANAEAAYQQVRRTVNQAKSYERGY